MYSGLVVKHEDWGLGLSNRQTLRGLFVQFCCSCNASELNSEVLAVVCELLHQTTASLSLATGCAVLVWSMGKHQI